MTTARMSAPMERAEGHPWEVAHNPGWTIGEDGSVRLQAGSGDGFGIGARGDVGGTDVADDVGVVRAHAGVAEPVERVFRPLLLEDLVGDVLPRGRALRGVGRRSGCRSCPEPYPMRDVASQAGAPARGRVDL